MTLEKVKINPVKRNIMKNTKVKGEYFLIDLGDGLRGEVRKAAVDAKETMKQFIRTAVKERLKRGNYKRG